MNRKRNDQKYIKRANEPEMKNEKRIENVVSAQSIFFQVKIVAE